MDDILTNEAVNEKEGEKRVKNNLSAKKSRSKKQKDSDVFYSAVNLDLLEPITRAVHILNNPTPRKKRNSVANNSAEKLEFLQKQITDLKATLIPGFNRWQEKYDQEIIVYTEKQKIKKANSELSKQALKQKINGPKLPRAALKVFVSLDKDPNN